MLDASRRRGRYHRPPSKTAPPITVGLCTPVVEIIDEGRPLPLHYPGHGETGVYNPGHKRAGGLRARPARVVDGAYRLQGDHGIPSTLMGEHARGETLSSPSRAGASFGMAPPRRTSSPESVAQRWPLRGPEIGGRRGLKFNVLLRRPARRHIPTRTHLPCRVASVSTMGP